MHYCGVENLDELIEKIKDGVINADETYKQYVIRLSSSGLAPKSVTTWSSALRKLFEANDIRLTKRLKVKSYVIHEDILPTKDELRRVVNSCDLRARTAILILTSSGLRIGELHKLKLRDVDFNKIPLIIRVRGIEAKERKGRITFMSDEAKESLILYLDRRRRMGHTISDDSPVIATDDGRLMNYFNLEVILRNALSVVAKKEGKRYTIHPHTLRKWFKTQLISAGVPGPIADRLCGHSRYMAEEYELYTEDKLAEWYKKAEPNLTIAERRGRAVSKEDIAEMARATALSLAKRYGISIEEIDIKIRKLIEEKPEITYAELVGEVMGDILCTSMAKLGIKPFEVKTVKAKEESNPSLSLASSLA